MVAGRPNTIEVKSHVFHKYQLNELTLMSSDRDEFSVFHRSERCVISLEREVDEHVVILQLQNAI